jgi:CRISPR-associated protein Cmr3
LRAVDTLFFRDGTPFSSEGAGQAEVGGTFPPGPETIAGAMRAALARANGWDEKSPRWPREFNAVLGDGPDDLGCLKFSGPFVVQCDKGWLPAPRHVLGIKDGNKWLPKALLGPGTTVACDLGSAVRLPEVVHNPGSIALQELKPSEEWWLRAKALPSVLSGALPQEEDLRSEKDLWCMERRVGIALNPKTRSVEEGMLYQARHMRPVGDTALEVWVDGLPSGWPDPAPLIPLGGERRMAEIEVCSEKEKPLFSQEKVGKLPEQFMVVLLTPALLAASDKPQEAFGALLPGARLICVVADRPLRIGGWYSHADSKAPGAPRAVRSFLPAGSVLFYMAHDPGRIAERIDANGFVRLGERSHFGFGIGAIGAWPRMSDTRGDR